jgi:fructose-bisphosphate aldolase class I
MTTTLTYERQLEKIMHAPGFIAALDQSGGSTPKALRLYGIPDDAYVVGSPSMYDHVHEMRSRIMTSPSFNGDRILGVILFEDTMDRTIAGQPTASYLWKEHGIVPFVKVDQGLEEEKDGVQLMKPLTKLEMLLTKAKTHPVFGTKMRSFIKDANEKGIKMIVEQQFNVAKNIIAHGFHPILEPEIDIHCPKKAEAEVILKECLLEHLNALAPNEKVLLKLTLPSNDNFYKECIEHPNVLRVVALSGGYTRDEANAILARNENMVASFSRALTEGLSAKDLNTDFDTKLDDSIAEIYFASTSGI